MGPTVIAAAGVVLVRQGASGPEVAVVHRPHRSDWSLPKGKLERGERHDVAAVRETFEETGVRCALGPFLDVRTYEVDGVPKRVEYWRATPIDHVDRDPDGEIDEIRWLAREAATEQLSYPEDRELLAAALDLPDTVVTVVLRHAQATKRVAWRASDDPLADDDAARPLDDHGVEQALALVDVLAAYGPRRVVSSDARRCRATVEPYADAADLPLVVEHALSEEGAEDDPDETRAVVRALAADVRSAVWCSHRPVLPLLLAELGDALGAPGDPLLDPRLAPGAALLVHRAVDDGRIVAIDHLAP